MSNEKAIPKLWQHQYEAVQRARSLDSLALFFPPGTGKTATLISILREKYQHYDRIIPTLIFCPPIVITNWKSEFLVWSKIPGKNITCLRGSAKEKEKVLSNILPNSVVITNYESLNQPRVFSALAKFLISDTAQVLALDESHRCKATTSKRTKRAIEFGDICKHKYILTGTPVLNNLMDLFSQFRILDGGKLLGSNFVSYRLRYFEDKNKFLPKARYFPNWQPIPGSGEKIKQLIAPVAITVDKEKCLDLPPLINKTIEVPMGEEQARLYKEMKQSLIAVIQRDEIRGDKVAVADLAITKALRLQQIVSGHLRFEENGDVKTFQIKSNPRKEALKELLQDITPGHKVIVWAVFHANYEDIREVCKDLKLGIAELHGKISDKDEQVSKFTTDKSCRVLIGHPGSGGIGVNLIAASYSIFYSRSFSLEFDIQAEARNRRGGSEIHDSITRIDLVTPGTIDAVVMKSLASKVAISNSILKEKIGEF